MSVEELEIIVTAKVEGAIKEFKKIVPTTRKIIQQVQESFGKIDTKIMTNKIEQAVQFIKNRIEDLKRSNKNNNIKISVNNKDAQKQISEVQKQIDSLEKKINSRQIKLNLINNTLDKIKGNTNQDVIQDMPNANNKMIHQETYKRLENNSSYTSLIQESDKLNSEIIKYNLLLDTAKGNMTQLEQETSKNAISQNKSTSFFSAFKGKLDETKTKAGGLQNIFGNIPKITKNITNNIKGIGSGLKNGLGSIVKYVSSLFSLKDIYGILSNCAQSWLSSQNAEAQQFSANIEYMKYAMGSVFAPVIQIVINMVYQLMKAIQSVVYAFSGVNIFAKATATSMGKTAGNAKQTSKSLSSIHSEINNLSDTSSSGSDGGTVGPNMDLSQMDNTTNSMIEAIKNGNWNELGATIGQKLNDAMNSIPWNKIQNASKKVGTGIAQTLNGFIATTDWNQVGNTFAQGINTIIYFGYNFVTTFDWKQFGNAIGNSINGLFNNIDWGTAAQGLSKGIIGIFNSISSILETVNWTKIGEDIKTFIQNIDWGGIWEAIKETIINAIGANIDLAKGLFGEDIVNMTLEPIINLGKILMEVWETNIKPIIESIKQGLIDTFGKLIEVYNQYIAPFIDKIKEDLTILWNEHIKPLLDNISELIIMLWENVLKPLIDWFIQNIIPVLVPIFESIWNTISKVFGNILDIISGVIGVFKGIIEFIVGIFTGNWEKAWQGIKDFFSGIWDIIKGIVSTVWNTICGIISTVINSIKAIITTILNVISNVWNSVWNGIKTVVINVWNGIWNTIRNVINCILGGIEGFVNGIIRGINVLLKGISSIANAVGSLIGLNPINLQLSTISLPRLAKGGVLYNETMFIGGEYSGANSNPEIVTPQNIMEETFDRVMSRYQSNSSGQQHLSIYYMGKEIFDDTIDYINEKTRRTGKCVIKVT